jgi:hypothetical protein
VIFVLHQRLDTVLPGAIKRRRHDVECHEERKADHHDVCRRRLQSQTGPQERKSDHESGEAGHHDEKAGRQRQYGKQCDQLDDPAAGASSARREKR